MRIEVGPQSARVFLFDSKDSSLTINSTIDLNSGKRIDDLFQDAALDAGFLPDIGSGAIASPMTALLNRAQELNAHARPYTIILRAGRDFTALDGVSGLEDLQIIVQEGS